MARHQGHSERILIGLADGAPFEFQEKISVCRALFERRSLQGPPLFVKRGGCPSLAYTRLAMHALDAGETCA